MKNIFGQKSISIPFQNVTFIVTSCTVTYIDSMCCLEVSTSTTIRFPSPLSYTCLSLRESRWMSFLNLAENLFLQCTVQRECIYLMTQQQYHDMNAVSDLTIFLITGFDRKWGQNTSREWYSFRNPFRSYNALTTYP